MKSEIALPGLSSILRASPTLIMTSMMVSFLTMLIVQIFYHAEYTFGGVSPQPAYSFLIAFMVAIIFQAARLSFGVSGAYEFATGRVGKGILGLLFSLALTVLESYEVADMAHHLSESTTVKEQSFLIAGMGILWIGLALEVRLAINLYKSGFTLDNSEEDYPETLSPTPKQQRKPKVKSESNGQHENYDEEEYSDLEFALGGN